ncbi:MULTISPECIES: hypothetical protein [unclassified Yoonia]|uniref:hypothetical protein n=1 Tax=unclassified Yoonia TaxID=2629118 RepID=UPI002B0018D9|nr:MULTISPECIES: hypothetical protein [unclassified Yoonia]
MLEDFNKDRVTLVKPDGQVAKEEFGALVLNNKVYTADLTLRLEVGDHLLRKLPNGLVEDYEIIDPKYYNLGSDSHFNIDVRKIGVPQSKATVVQDITNIFHGANARMNMNSTDNSINLASDISQEQLRDFINQVRPVVSLLPEENREAVMTELRKIEVEAEKPKPSALSVMAALQSIKSVAEGASGNLVAAGIISLIGSSF